MRFMMVSRKQRRKLERTGKGIKQRGAGVQRATNERLAAEKPLTFQETLGQAKINPYIFLGILPVVSWLSLITLRPELRDQMTEKYRELAQGLFPSNSGDASSETPQLEADSRGQNNDKST